MWKLTINPRQEQEKFGFHLGDRVMFIEDEDCDCGVSYGDVGTVCHFDSYRVGVRWDSMTSGARGHTCSGNCDRGHGWYVSPKELSFEFPEEPICMESDDLTAFMGLIQ